MHISTRGMATYSNRKKKYSFGQVIRYFVSFYCYFYEEPTMHNELKRGKKSILAGQRTVELHCLPQRLNKHFFELMIPQGNLE